MKILHVLAQLPAKTGSGVYFSNMVEGFKKYKHQQKAIYARQGNFKWQVLEEEDKYPVNFNQGTLPFPIVGMSDVMPYENTTYTSMTDEMIRIWKDAFKSRLLKVKEEFQPDIIFAHHLWMLSSLVREIFPDSKIVGICHNTDLRQASMNPELKKAHVKNISKLDLIFSASDQQKDEIVEEYGVNRENIVAVGGGFNQDIFYFPEEKKEDGKIRLVFCAKIDPSKGIYELIKVYKSLNIPDVSLDIIGTPNKENKKKINRLIDGDPSISLYNVKNQESLGDELRKKDIFLMPSFYEGLGLMAIESLACGLYVVTTEIEALMSLLGEEIKESGVIKYVKLPRIYNVDKPVEEDLPEFRDRLKSAILEQVENVRANRELPIQMKGKINSFSWDGLVGRMNKIIENFAESK